MKYVGKTSLPHGEVLHYLNGCGNIESVFQESEK